MHSIKIEAEHFLDNPSHQFVFNQNPFKSDIMGKQIQFENLDMDDHLHLVADLSTLRVASWLKNEAFAIADVQNAPYSPRHVLKQALAVNSFKSAQIQKLTFQLYKQAPSSGQSPIHDHLTSTNNGVLMTDNCHRSLILEFKKLLHETGIPIESI